MNSSSSSSELFIYQAAESIGHDEPLLTIKSKIAELSNIRNLNFLFGAGTSSEAIPDMKSMFKVIDSKISKKAVSPDCQALFKHIHKTDLESLLGILHSKRAYLEGMKDDKDSSITKQLATTNKLIEFVETEMFNQINIKLDDAKALSNIDVYKTFYQKVVYRNKDLARTNVFTTNNDILNEKALDTLSINFNSGFSSGIDRYFNPARFNYTYSKKIDANLEKFEPLEDMVYLYKLHGSINWVESTGHLFNIQEVPIKDGEKKDDSKHTLIYPTPMKQTQSLGAPYSDLIRCFQGKLSLPNSVLFVAGYSFSDEHLNNIVYQSLASNSSLTVVIFGEHPNCPLVNIKDPRIIRIYGKDGSSKVHYFRYISEKLLPEPKDDPQKKLLENIVDALADSDLHNSGPSR